jgi:hypothetical protein
VKPIKSNVKTKSICWILFLWLPILLNCSNGPVSRDNRGLVLSSPQQQDSFLKGQNLRKKILLLPLFNEAPLGGDDLAFFTSADLRNELFRTGEVLVEPNSELEASSKDIYSGGGVKLVQLGKKAKNKGINLIFFGRIMAAKVRDRSDEIGILRQSTSFGHSQVEIKIFDVQANKEIFSQVSDGRYRSEDFLFFLTSHEERQGSRQDLLRYTVRQAVRKLMPKIKEVTSRLDWTGRVAKVVGTKIYINAGRNSGIQVGDILKVIMEGEPIFDPDTGGIIGVAKGDVKGTLEVIDYFGSDGAIATLHSGGQILEGDFVQLY